MQSILNLFTEVVQTLVPMSLVHLDTLQNKKLITMTNYV